MTALALRLTEQMSLTRRCVVRAEAPARCATCPYDHATPAPCVWCCAPVRLLVASLRKTEHSQLAANALTPLPQALCQLQIAAEARRFSARFAVREVCRSSSRIGVGAAKNTASLHLARPS